MVFIEQPLGKIYTKISGSDMTSRNHALNEFIKVEEARITKNNNIIRASVTYKCMCMYIWLEACIEQLLSMGGMLLGKEEKNLSLVKEQPSLMRGCSMAERRLLQ